MSSPEFDFVSRFLTLATLSDPVLGADYKLPLQKVSNQGIALPPLKYKYDPQRARNGASKGDSKNSTLTLTLKSVRPPKFSLECQFSGKETVLQVKQKLVEEGKAQGTENLKLLLKGKVLHDSELLSGITPDTAIINVMVSKTVQAVTSPTASSANTSSEPPTTQIPWNKIEDLLCSSFTNRADAQKALDRLQRGWNLAE